MNRAQGRLDRQQMTWARIAAIATVAAAILTATGIGVAVVLDDDGGRPDTPPPQVRAVWRPTHYVMPGLPESLPTPPDYVPDGPDAAEAHCEDWREWARENGAASHLPNIEVSAPRETSVSVTEIALDVEVSQPEVTDIACQEGAGGYDAIWAHLDLTRPEAPVVVEADVGGPWTLPPDGFRVEPGETQSIALYARTFEPERWYEITIELEVVSDREVHRFRFGADQPYTYSTFELGSGARYDWDPNGHEWVDANDLSEQRHPK